MTSRASAPARTSSERRVSGIEAHTSDDLVTVVIPARNEERSIGACLDSVLAQDHSNLQVIVVDGASSDRTAAIVRAYGEGDPRVELVSNPQAVIPKSLNRALAAARAAWLVRVDAHSTVPPDYVTGCLAHLRTGEWGGVGGRKDGVGETPAGRAIAAALASRFGVGNSTYHHGTVRRAVEHIPFGAYPTELLRRVGGWDERLSVNEDFELDHRLQQAGHRLLFDPSLAITWRSRQTIPQLFAQYRRYGRGKAEVARLHPGSLRPRHLAAPALVALLAVTTALVPRRPLLAAAAVAPYPLALAAATAVTARKLDDRKALPWVPAAFAAMHVGWGLGFWEGVLSGGRGRRASLSRASARKVAPS
jgi:succinoglycan biosynthesis protein ExoA